MIVSTGEGLKVNAVILQVAFIVYGLARLKALLAALHCRLKVLGVAQLS